MLLSAVNFLCNGVHNFPILSALHINIYPGIGKTSSYLNEIALDYQKLTLSSRVCFSDSRDFTVLSSFSRIPSLMFFDNPDNSFKLGCTLVMISEESIPKVADNFLIVLMYFSTL